MPDLDRGPAPHGSAPSPVRCEGQVGGRRAVWYESGSPDGPTLLLLHGGGADAALVSWPLVLRAFPERRVIAPDLPGYGGSARARGVHTVEALSDWVGEFSEAIALAPGALAGVSMGGAVAIRRALAAPDRARALIPIAPFGLFGPIVLPPHVWLATRLPIAGLSFAGATTSDRVARRLLARVFADRSRITPELVAAFRLAARRQAGATAFDAFLRHEMAWRRFRTDLSARLPEIGCPTLFVHGTADALVPASVSRRAVALTPGARLALIEGAGHAPMREAPEAFERAVRAFLDEADPAGRD